MLPRTSGQPPPGLENDEKATTSESSFDGDEQSLVGPKIVSYPIRRAGGKSIEGLNHETRIADRNDLKRRRPLLF